MKRIANQNRNNARRDLGYYKHHNNEMGKALKRYKKYFKEMQNGPIQVDYDKSKGRREIRELDSNNMTTDYIDIEKLTYLVYIFINEYEDNCNNYKDDTFINDIKEYIDEMYKTKDVTEIEKNLLKSTVEEKRQYLINKIYHGWWSGVGNPPTPCKLLEKATELKRKILDWIDDEGIFKEGSFFSDKKNYLLDEEDD